MENPKLSFKIFYDQNPSNPFTEWDGMAPLMWKGPQETKADYSEGGILDFILKSATDGKVIRNQRALMNLLCFSLYDEEYSNKAEKADLIRDQFYNRSIVELGSICEILKIPYLRYTSKGYSQGDWADVLIVLTDDFYESTGAYKSNVSKVLKATSELFDQYMWGDVYGFQIIESSTCKSCTHTHHEIKDSCWGFYGDDFENNGMIDHFPESLHQSLIDFDKSNIQTNL